MLTDQYDLPLSTTSVVARDAYIRGSELALTLYPGAMTAFEQALEADPNFALAHAAKAQVFFREANPQAARAAQAAAQQAALSGVTEREASHLTFWDLLLDGRTQSAIKALYAHLDSWPRDALVLATSANPNGLIGASGQIGQKHRIALLLDAIANAYGDDPWFLAHHAMALSEDGRHAEARPMIERAVAMKRDNAHGAHAFAHVCYESGDLPAARDFLASWLPDYPTQGFFHGHISWHHALCELAAGEWENAQRFYSAAIFLDAHSGGPQQKISDGAAFLWRAELAGFPRDTDAWQALHAFGQSALPQPGSGLADMHVILTEAVTTGTISPPMRAAQITTLAEDGRYPSADFLPTLARGIQAFEQANFQAAIDALAPLMGQNERIGGSRAQHDLIEFTLLKAYLQSDRNDDAKKLLAMRRQGATPIPVAGIEALN